MAKCFVLILKREEASLPVCYKCENVHEIAIANVVEISS